MKSQKESTSLKQHKSNIEKGLTRKWMKIKGLLFN